MNGTNATITGVLIADSAMSPMETIAHTVIWRKKRAEYA